MAGMQRRTKLKILKAARALISDRKNWTKGAWRREKRSGVVAYCALGALQEAYLQVKGRPDPYDDLGTELAERLSIAALARAKHGAGVTSFNDRAKTKHADVLALFDERIAQLEAGA